MGAGNSKEGANCLSQQDMLERLKWKRKAFGRWNTHYRLSPVTDPESFQSFQAIVGSLPSKSILWLVPDQVFISKAAVNFPGFLPLIGLNFSSITLYARSIDLISDPLVRILSWPNSDRGIVIGRLSRLRTLELPQEGLRSVLLVCSKKGKKLLLPWFTFDESHVEHALLALPPENRVDLTLLDCTFLAAAGAALIEGLRRRTTSLGELMLASVDSLSERHWRALYQLLGDKRPTRLFDSFGLSSQCIFSDYVGLVESQSRIQRLELHNCVFPDDGAALLQAIESGTSPLQLHLQVRHQLSFHKELLQALQSPNCVLTHLWLFVDFLLDSGQDSIPNKLAQALRHNTSLEYLGLSNIEGYFINNHGKVLDSEFVVALVEHPNLKEVEVAYPPHTFDQWTGQHLIAVLQNAPHISISFSASHQCASSETWARALEPFVNFNRLYQHYLRLATPTSTKNRLDDRIRTRGLQAILERCCFYSTAPASVRRQQLAFLVSNNVDVVMHCLKL